ncbi:unnamed protein product [Brugia pahangi]|uniref:Anaphase-promoting complex subunit 1 n=1 Tax=Brugia pahangi TaxID=6280 RepID=A0A0N4TSF4_BRUPA|nr:unnamed protein product [Brugia pahangi]
MTLKVAQVPCHLIRDAHEWINEIPTVPYLLPNEGERAWQTAGKEVTLSQDDSGSLVLAISLKSNKKHCMCLTL